MKQIQHEVIIIGGGPAGLAAALYMGRAGLEPLLFAGSPPGGQLMLTTDVENFPGQQAILGPELIATLRKQVAAFHVDIKDQNITNIKINSNKSFLLKAGDDTHTAAAVLITTGAKALWLGLDSEAKLRGRGVSACATCDGFFFKNKDVAVIGGGDTALEEAQTLTHFADKVYLIHRRNEFRASKIMQDRVMSNPKIHLVLGNQIQEILGDMSVQGIVLQNPFEGKNTLSLQGVFVAIGHKPDTDIFESIVSRDEKGYIYTSSTKALASAQVQKLSPSDFDYTYQSMTSVPGIFAAGDCVDSVYRQAGTAAGMGIASALDIERYLIRER